MKTIFYDRPVSAASRLIARWHGRKLGVPPDELYSLFYCGKTPKELWLYAALSPVVAVVCVNLADPIAMGGVSGLLWFLDRILVAPSSVIARLEELSSGIETFIALIVALLLAAPFLCFMLRRYETLLFAAGRLSVCTKCGYQLDRSAKDAVRCPECGTLNDASKWLINREGKSDEGQESA